MNRIYRLIWNRSLRVLQVASEITRPARSGGATQDGATPLRQRPLAAACVAALAMAAYASPGWAATCTINGVTYTNTCAQGGTGAAGSSSTTTAGGTGGMGSAGAGNSGGAGGISSNTGYTGSSGVSGAGPISSNGGSTYHSGGGAGTYASGIATPGAGGLTSRGSGGAGGGGYRGTGQALVADAGGGGGAGGGLGTQGVGGGGGGGTGGPGYIGSFSAGGGGGGGGGLGQLISTGSLSNASTNGITGGAGGKGAAGNTATGVSGYAGGGGGGGGGGAGVYVGTGADLTNSGGISGGLGGAGGASSIGAAGGGGGGGSGVLMGKSSSLSNNGGSIVGGNGGAGAVGGTGGTGGSGGAGGYGLVASGSDNINTSGNISGGLSGNGLTRANAVYLSGGANTLNLSNGYSFTGNVISASGTTQGGDILSLVGDNGSFDVSAIASTQPASYTGSTQYYGFTGYRKLGVGTWTLTHTTSALTPWSIMQGTLAVGSDGALGSDAGAITLDVGGTLQATQSFALYHNITLGSQGGNILVNSGANLTLNAPVTGSGPLSVEGPGVLTLGANVNTGSAQFYNSATMLGNNVTVSNTGGDSIAFGSTLDGAYALSVNSSGTLTFGGPVGSMTALGSLTAIATGGITLDGNVSTVGAQTYSSAVTLGSDVTATSAANGSIGFNSNVDGAHALAISTNGTATFGGTVGSAVPLSSLAVNATGGITLGSNVTTTGVQTYANAATLSGNVGLTSTGNGNIAFGSTLNGAYGLQVNTGGGLSFGGATSLASLSSASGTLTTSGSLNVTGNLSVSTGSGAISQGGTYTVGGTSSFSAGSYAITLANAANQFSGVVSLSNTGANNVALNNNGALTLGNVAVGSGSLSLSGQGLSQAGGTAITQAPSAGAVTLSGNGNAVILGNTTNNFTGLVSADGSAVSLYSSGALNVANINSTGSAALWSGNGLALMSGSVSGGMLSLVTGGTISQSLNASITTTTLSGSSGGSTTLAGSNNDITSLSNFTANGFSLTNASALSVMGSINGTFGAINLTTTSGSLGIVGGNSVTTTGAVTLDAAGALTIGGNVSGDTVTLNTADALSIDGNVSGNAVVLDAAGNTVLIGSLGSQATSGTTLSGGTLQVGNGGTAGTLTGNVTDNTSLIFNRSDNLTYAGTVTGTGSLVKQAANTLTLTGNNTYSGLTTINAGTLQIGNGGTSGAIAGDVADNSALVFNRSDALNYGGAITGTGSLTQAGSGTLTLDGNSSSFAGNTTVAAGTLVVGSVAGNGAALGGNVAVASGATLRGHGSIGGDVDLLSGGTVEPGDSIGTLTVNGNFTAAQGSTLNYAFGAPGANAQALGTGDSIHVGGNLALNGVTLNVSDAGGMGPGLYNLFTYGGLLSQTNGGLILGTTPAGQPFVLQNLTSQRQINLLDITGYTVNIWNANGQASATQMGGGNGTWSTVSPNWASADASVTNAAMTPQPGFAIFGGAPGTVTVDDSAGAVSATGMQFAVDGYALTGGALALVANNGNAPIIRVGDGSSAGTGMTATIGNVLTGTAGLTKADLGTLVLTSTNTYTGGTTINGGTLSVSSDANLGDASGGLAFNGGTLENTAAFTTARTMDLVGNGTLRTDADLTVTSAIAGSGTLSKTGGATLTLDAANTYTGATAIQAGTLALSGAGSIARSSGVSVAVGATFDISGANNGASITSLNGSGNVNLASHTLTLTGASGSFGGIIAGSGGLAIVTGNETLTGNNIYTGTTMIGSGSTLALGNGGAAGAVAGNVQNDGALVLDRGDTSSLGGVISGTGTLTQAGSGTLALAGANTYTGATAIAAGTLALTGAGSIAASSGVNVAGNASFDISGTSHGASIVALTGAGSVNLGQQTLTLSNASGSFAGVIGGAGGLTLQGGTETLTGANTYTGGTTINSGTLQIGNGGTQGTLVGAVNNNGTLAFALSDDTTFSGAIAGSGTVVQNGNGNLTLSGINTYSGGTVINAGTLTGDTNSLQGNMVDHGSLVFDQVSDGIYAGVLSGAGSFTKSGAGTLILNGQNSFSGSTSITAGTLEVGDASTPGASLGGQVQVGSAGTLRGHGTINGNVVNDGVVRPGGSVGTLTINGNFTQSSTGQLAIDTAPDGTGSRLVVNGAVSLAGSALFILPSSTWQANTNYQVLTASGPVSGQFASVTSNFAFVTPTLQYSANGISLALARNNVSFPTVADTPNAKAVAAATESLGAGQPLYDTVMTLDTTTATKAFEQLQGEIHASTRTAILENDRYVRDAIGAHLTGVSNNADSHSASNDAGVTAWTSAWGHWGSHDSNGNAAQLDSNGSGVVVGADLAVAGDNRLGAVLGSGQGTARSATPYASAHHLDTYAGIYGDTQLGAVRLQGGAVYGWQKINTSRTLGFGNVNGAADSRYNANTTQAFADASYAFLVGRSTLAPFVNVAYDRISTDDIRENGTIAPLNVAGNDSAITVSTLGVRGSFQLDDRGGLRANVSLGWQHASGDVTPVASEQFAAGGNMFSVSGVPVAKNAAAVNAGVSFQITPSATVDATYGGQFGHGVTDQSARMSLTWTF